MSDEVAREVVRAACPHDCPDTCAMLVTVENGVATGIRGDPSMPFTEGTLCTKVAHYLERTYAPDRLLYPMKRIGRKGRGEFERISWDQALDEIAARLKALAQENPETILPCSYAGTMGMVQYSSMDRRFFHRLGASLLDRTLCSSAGKSGLKATLGGSVGMDPERFDEAKLILLWGANPIVSNMHLWSRVQQAKRRGAKVIAIDPYRSLSAEKCTQHIALLPGTDGALALGMMHVLISEGLLDRDYIASHTLGYEALEKRALEKYPPEWAARTCGISRDEVIRLAREYGSIRPAAIRLNYGMQRHSGGGMAARTIACLPALVGAWREPAGGIVLSTADFYGFDHAGLERPDLLAGRRPRVINQARLGEALTSAEPPVRAVIVYNNNPVAVCPESDKVIAGFSREDLFTVVLDHFQTDTAEDICRSALASAGARMKGIAWESAKRSGWQKLDVPERFAPFAAGGFPTPSGKCEFYSEFLKNQGIDPLPFYNPPAEASDDALRQRFPLAFVSPPARHFLNSSFANMARFREFEGEPHLEMHPNDAGARGIRDGDRVRVFNERGGYTLKARVNGKPRRGVVVAPSVWWKKYARDRANANNVTSQRTTDIGGGATFYDCLVQVERVDAPLR